MALLQATLYSVWVTYPGDDGYGDTKGWDRASIAFGSRNTYAPDINAADLLLPNEAGKLEQLAMCAVCSFCMTFLYVAFPLWAVSLFFDLGIWFPVALTTTMVVSTAVLFVVSTYETRDLRRLSKEL